MVAPCYGITMQAHRGPSGTRLWAHRSFPVRADPGLVLHGCPRHRSNLYSILTHLRPPEYLSPKTRCPDPPQGSPTLQSLTEIWPLLQKQTQQRSQFQGQCATFYRWRTYRHNNISRPACPPSTSDTVNIPGPTRLPSDVMSKLFVVSLVICD